MNATAPQAAYADPTALPFLPTVLGLGFCVATTSSTLSLNVIRTAYTAMWSMRFARAPPASLHQPLYGSWN
jgi:hypothetical protein